MVPKTQHPDREVYVGNLPPDIRPIDIEDLFCYCGDVTRVEVRRSRGTPYAFVVFTEAEHAALAVTCRNGLNYDGYVLKVEFSKFNLGITGFMDFKISQRSRLYPRGDWLRSTRSRSECLVHVYDLPRSVSWQDLKDHMRGAGQVAFADTHKDGTGVVEYSRRNDALRAVKVLNGSKITSIANEVGYIRVKTEITDQEKNVEISDSSTNVEDSESSHGKRSRGKRHKRKSRSSETHSPRKRQTPTYSPIRRSPSYLSVSSDRVSRGKRGSPSYSDYSPSTSRSPSPINSPSHPRTRPPVSRSSTKSRSPTKSRSSSISRSSSKRRSSSVSSPEQSPSKKSITDFPRWTVHSTDLTLLSLDRLSTL